MSGFNFKATTNEGQFPFHKFSFSTKLTSEWSLFKDLQKLRLMNDFTMRPPQQMMETVDLIHIPAGPAPLGFHCLWPDSGPAEDYEY